MSAMLMRAAILAVVALSVAVSAGHAHAHAYPTTTVPAKDATISTAPTEVAIEFDDELEPKFSTIHVHDAHGAVVSTGTAHVAPNDPKHLTVALKKLLPGRYTVNWTATDTDTHKTKGSFTFIVAP